jgi:hypothetical protein
VSTFAEGAVAALGLVFLVAGTGKLVAPGRFRTTLLLSRAVSPRLVPMTRVGLPLLELSVAALLFSDLLHPLGPALALGLLAAVTVRTWPAAMVWRAGAAVSCSCLGTTGERLDAGLVARNLVLIAYGIVAVMAPATPGDRPSAAFAPVTSPAAWATLVTALCLGLIPSVLAETVSIQWATARVPSLPSLPDVGADDEEFS